MTAMDETAAPYWRMFAEGGVDLQAPFDAAVVMPSVVRPTVARALRSIFAQDFGGRLQVLVGVDRPGDLAPLEQACASRPSHCVVQAFWPGYSTSVRHGGLCAAQDGGVLRCILSHLANSPFLAYLDDDNWWATDHLTSLRRAIEGADYAHALRWFVHPGTGRAACVDIWESVGPGQGAFSESFGGFVDPNCLMIDKRRCGAAVAQWVNPLPGDAKGMSADRNVFAALRPLRSAPTGRATAFYVLDPADGLHPQRLLWMGEAWTRAAAAQTDAPR